RQLMYRRAVANPRRVLIKTELDRRTRSDHTILHRDRKFSRMPAAGHVHAKPRIRELGRNDIDVSFDAPRGSDRLRRSEQAEREIQIMDQKIQHGPTAARRIALPLRPRRARATPSQRSRFHITQFAEDLRKHSVRGEKSQYVPDHEDTSGTMRFLDHPI